MAKLPLHKNLTELLKDQNLSRIAVKARMNKSTLHGYLNGIEPRSLLGLTRLAEVLNVSPKDLVFGQTPAPSTEEERFEVTIKRLPQRPK